MIFLVTQDDFVFQLKERRRLGSWMFKVFHAWGPWGPRQLPTLKWTSTGRKIKKGQDHVQWDMKEIMGVSNSRGKLISCSSVILSIQEHSGAFIKSWWLSLSLFYKYKSGGMRAWRVYSRTRHGL